MADMTGRKRKAPAEPTPRPAKKAAGPKTAAVTSLVRARYSAPIIATAPGMTIETGTTFESDEKRAPRGRHRPRPELVLHSSQHKTLDYIAREELSSGGEKPLRHYLAVYDPSTGELKVVEAKRMVIRGVVRARQAPAEAMEPPPYATMADRRAELSMTFGTKKAKQALQSDALNTISSSKKNADGSTVKLDAASRAIMDSIGEATANMASRADLKAAMGSAKPVPKPNLAAQEIHQVYDPDVLIGPTILNMIPVTDWQESLARDEPIKTISRFVAHRIKRIASTDHPFPRLRLLRYLLFCIQLKAITKPGSERGVLKLPSRAVLRDFLSPAPDAVIDHIRRQFADGGNLRKFHVDLLSTHCCAFAAILDNFEVDTLDLREDLRLDQNTINTYFREIGAEIKVSQTKDGEKKIKRVIAKLSLPLAFPEQRPARKRR